MAKLFGVIFLLIKLYLWGKLVVPINFKTTSEKKSKKLCYFTLYNTNF